MIFNEKYAHSIQRVSQDTPTPHFCRLFMRDPRAFRDKHLSFYSIKGMVCMRVVYESMKQALRQEKLWFFFATCPIWLCVFRSKAIFCLFSTSSHSIQCQNIITVCVCVLHAWFRCIFVSRFICGPFFCVALPIYNGRWGCSDNGKPTGIIDVNK